VDLKEVKQNLLTEELIQEIEEEEYKPCNIIDGYNIIVQAFTNDSDLDLALRENDPQVVIMYEPILDFMRAIELYNAERDESIEVHVLKFTGDFEGSDFIQQCDDESTAFK